MQQTKIEWTDKTWNPVRGCSMISDGCTHCYAMPQAHRSSKPGKAYEGLTHLTTNGPRWTGAVRLVEERLFDPLKWKKPWRIFVNSMSDLFHERLPDDDIARVADVMIKAHWHTYQVLTKRAPRMRDLLTTKLRRAAALPHIWWGVSVENKKYGLPRIDLLRSIPVEGIRFLSIEPLLEDLGSLDLTGIHWVIVGGESGPGARPMEPEWVRSIRDQCRGRRVPFFFKQWGGVRKHETGRLLDGKNYDEMPVGV
jgi:protein gp37